MVPNELGYVRHGKVQVAAARKESALQILSYELPFGGFCALFSVASHGKLN